MIFTKEQVFEVCKTIAPIYKFDVTLIQALCLQEGGKNADGSFAPSRARLEQGFYVHYVEKQNYATTSEVLLSASYGVTQMMGESLKEIQFFEWYFSQQSDSMKQLLGNPYSEFCVPNAIDAYCDNLNWQVEWGCKWLSKKRDMAHGDITKALGYWNGDTSGKYANEVLTKQKMLG